MARPVSLSLCVCFFSLSHHHHRPATYYGLQTPTGSGNCGLSRGGAIPAWVRGFDYTVAINAPQYGSGGWACGACLSGTSRGVGLGATPPKATFLAYVVDKCPECAFGSLDLAVNGDGRWDISWKAVPCPVGNSKVTYVLEGSNAFFLKVRVANTPIPLRALDVFVGGRFVAAQKTQDNAWQVSAGQMAVPLLVRMTSIANEVLNDTLPSVTTNDVLFQGSVQFGAGNAATTQAPTTQAPTTQAPTTTAPTTQAPTTKAPTTQAPTTQAPTTQAPGGSGCAPLAVSVEIGSSWGNGYTAKVVVRNTGTTAVTDWQVVVKLGGGALSGTSVWNSVLVSSGGGQVILGAPSWATQLAPGQSVEPGFNVDGPPGDLSPVASAKFNGKPLATCGNAGGATTQAPTTQAPTTQAPTTQAPTTQAPTTKAPTTQLPTSTTTQAPVTQLPGTTSLSSSAVGDSVARFKQWVSVLTTMEGGNAYRAVHSSGGAAGGVVSEGQGYGVLLGGIVVASLPASHPDRAWAIQTAYELFKGWLRMCTLSASGSSCQSSFYCGGASPIPCLPHWKFDDAITSAQGTGSAIDGDEDAMLGMILLVKATDGANKPAFWDQVALHAHQTCRAFFEYGTTPSPNGNSRAPKLGSCWGGWDCSNPSYYAPAAYRACRDYMASRNDASLTAGWNLLLTTTYQLALATQCPATGLVPNWYVPNSASPATTGTTGCSGSGTPAATFGAEASRLVWRMAADYILYGTPEAQHFSTVAALQTISKAGPGGSWGSLDTGCLVTSIFSDWSNNAFIYAPLFTSLLVPTTSAGQAAALASAAAKVAAAPIQDYFAGSWVAIATVTISGSLRTAGGVLNGAAVARSATDTTTGSTAAFPAWAIAVATVGGALLLAGVIVAAVLVKRRRSAVDTTPLLRNSQRALAEEV
jgi:expansin (peptidoglycan-binding protein)